jgi:SAM-dependent methyltransferase
VVFVDADDRLMEDALEVGVEALNAHPDAAFVFGHYRHITSDGKPLYSLTQACAEADHYAALLRCNYIAMHSTVIYRRSIFDKVAAFDTSLRACEDYDLYLRIAREFPIHCHHQLVAEYRQHQSQMSRDAVLMMNSALAALKSQSSSIKGNKRYEEAYDNGVRFWREFYSGQLIGEIGARVSARDWRRAFRGLLSLMRHNSRRFKPLLIRQAKRSLADVARRTLPATARQWLRARVARRSLLFKRRARSNASNIKKPSGRPGAMLSSASRVLQSLLVCPVCKGALEISTAMIKCASCGSEFSQSSQEYFDLLPEHLLESEESRWQERQQEMGKWYGELIATPAAAHDCFARDYSPYAQFLASLSGTVLDIGGGVGIVRHYLPSDATYIVVDPSTDWLDADWKSLAERFPCLKASPCFVRGIGEYLPFDHQTFDTVLAFWSLNHASSPQEVFREAHRVLRSGGRFFAVLEDMVPGSQDVSDGMLSASGLAGTGMRADVEKLAPPNEQEWPLQPDHIRILESEIHAWISGRFEIMRRVWIDQYLTFEFKKK